MNAIVDNIKLGDFEIPDVTPEALAVINSGQPAPGMVEHPADLSPNDPKPDIQILQGEIELLKVKFSIIARQIANINEYLLNRDFNDNSPKEIYGA